MSVLINVKKNVKIVQLNIVKLFKVINIVIKNKYYINW